MSSLLLGAAAASALYVSGSAGVDANAPITAASMAAIQTQDAASTERALEWLALLDAGKVEASRAQAGSALRERHTAQIWELGVRLRSNNYGALIERTLLKVTDSSSQPHIGKGDFKVLVFKSDFLRVGDATERVVMQREGGAWRVADYDMQKPGKD